MGCGAQARGSSSAASAWRWPGQDGPGSSKLKCGPEPGWEDLEGQDRRHWALSPKSCSAIVCTLLMIGCSTLSPLPPLSPSWGPPPPGSLPRFPGRRGQGRGRMARGAAGAGGGRIQRNLRRETEPGSLASRARAGDRGRTRTETASQRQSGPEEDGRGEMEATSCGVKITKPPGERRPQTERGGGGSNGQRVGNRAESKTRGKARCGKEDRRQRSGGR